MRALILAPFADECLDRLRAQLDVTHESWLDTNRLQDPDELGARLAADDVSILVVEADFVFVEVFEAAPGLRFVATCRNALNQIDLEAAERTGVSVTHAPGRNTNAVVEMTLGLMLALARRIVPAHSLVSGGGWRDPSGGYRTFRGREIAGSVVGVVGFGQIGREVARVCNALGARVRAYDPLVPEPHMAALGVEKAELDVIAASDFVTLHVPDNDSTHRMIDAAFLRLMMRSAYLINTGGGGVVDAEALAEALHEGAISGAALDVFGGHPLPQSSALMSAPNVILTPHIGGATEETVLRHSRMITDDIERFIAGEPLLHAVVAPAASSRA